MIVRSLGQWQAFVMAADTTEERDRRQAEAPLNMQEQIQRHRQTVYSIRKYQHNQHNQQE